jgi:predicted alpha/beta-fold hydrolase
MALLERASDAMRGARRLPLHPMGPLRNAHVQSALGSLPALALMARRRSSLLRAAAQSLVLDCGEGVRLQALHSAQPGAAASRMVVLLHGWEGSADSSCVLSLGAALYAAGYAVLRLNLRDHGGSQHLRSALRSRCISPAFRSAATSCCAPLPRRRGCPPLRVPSWPSPQCSIRPRRCWRWNAARPCTDAPSCAVGRARCA